MFIKKNIIEKVTLPKNIFGISLEIHIYNKNIALKTLDAFKSHKIKKECVFMSNCIIKHIKYMIELRVTEKCLINKYT